MRMTQASVHLAPPWNMRCFYPQDHLTVHWESIQPRTRLRRAYRRSHHRRHGHAPSKAKFQNRMFAASDRAMGALLANSERFADNKSAPGVWDRITENGKAVWDSTGEAVDDAGRALRRAVTIDSPAEARARADEIALRRTRNQVAADLRAHGWGDNGHLVLHATGTNRDGGPTGVSESRILRFV